MDEFERGLERAGDAVAALADGPGRDAAASLERAFAEAGSSIESALSRAARSGELDFSRMTQSVLADLARIAAEAALAQAGLGGAQVANLNVNISGGAAGGVPVGTSKEIAKALGRAAAMGGRFL
ncbi:MAG: phage tail tape measure C-terminal domain-containing protein [Henriciella sp.]|uniref:phage tail tape measure C-terminal domain-containing protein n=1 Tax=Henriciella sp. TaxID=1968823 RepID=UPI003C72D17F